MSEGKIIKAVKLDLDGKEVDLTIEQAKKLQAALNGLFGVKVAKEVVHHHDFLPMWSQKIWDGPYFGDDVTSGVVATFDQQSGGTMTLQVA